MKPNFLLKAALVFILISGSFIVLWSSSNNRPNKSTCMETISECSTNENKNTSSGEMILETLTRQFFSSTEISN